MRTRLTQVFGRLRAPPILDPASQLIKSLISGRTRDPVSWRAYWRLARAYPQWSGLAAASVDEIRTVIADVTFPEIKAPQLRLAVQSLIAAHPDLDLGFLSAWPVGRALEWLERLAGVGRKVAAATLNFSTLQLPAFVVDTHVLRVLGRFGFVAENADTEDAYDAVMAAAMGWNGPGLAEFHSLVKRLGQTMCRHGPPHCLSCPLAARCRTAGMTKPSA